MVRVSVFAALLAAMTATGARAADQPLYQPQPAWVSPVAIPFDMKPSGASADMLLWTVQGRLRPNDDESFVEQAVRINSPEGLVKTGNIIEAWDPATSTLAIHRARILRGKQVIDLLAGGRTFTVLRRETNLEAAMIDGELTATLQPEGLQVGDVLDVAYTLTRNEPALAGHSEGGALIAHAGTVGRLMVRELWPAGAPMRTWQTDDLPALQPATHDGWTEIGFDQPGAVSPEPPKGAPFGDQLFGALQIADFSGWPEVSATAYPLYLKAATLKPDSPMKAEIARIRAASPDPKAQALAALELVESQIRYLYVGLNAGGFTPAPADLTWSRRFGDCKGKTVLLLALLRGLGVQAEPALVSTTGGDGLDRRLPEMSLFDHVMIRAVIGGKTYWLDATRLGDESLDALRVPNDRWALPLRAAGSELEPLEPANPALPMAETVLRVDAKAGIDRPASVHEELILRGDLGWAFAIAMRQASGVDRDRALRKALTSQRPWVTPDKVDFAYDPQKMESRVTLDGTGTPPFTSADGSAKGPRDWLIEGSGLGYDADLTRTSDYHRDAPYAVAYPSYARNTVEVQLPNGGDGFEAYNGESVSRTVAGVDYARTAAIAGSGFSMVATERAEARNFPASEAAAAEAGLRSLDGYQVSIRYTPPEKVASVAPGPEAGVATGSAADVAEAELLHKNYGAAETEFTQAIAAGPSATLYYRRAVVRAARGEDALAQADLDAALKLDPHDAYAAFGLGRYALRREDTAQAASRFAAAQAASGKPAEMASMIGGAYENAGRHADAFPYWDRAAAAISDAKLRAVVLNDSCFSRAEAGAELQHALEDCNASLALVPNASNVLDSRGLVDLRLGQPDKAIADYTAALIKRPDLPSSLYGRALAETRLGQGDKAKTDLAMARAMDPKIEATFAAWGVSR